MKVDPIYTEAVLALMARPEEFVPASALAPIVKMHPSVIIEYAKQGNWPFCKYVISGNHVKFARIDFLKHFGFIRDEDEKEVDPEEKDAEVRKIFEAFINAMTAIMHGQKALMSLMQDQNELLRQILEKSA